MAGSLGSLTSRSSAAMQIHASHLRAPAAPSRARAWRAGVRAASRPLQGALVLSLALAFVPSHATIYRFAPGPDTFYNLGCAAQFCNGSPGIWGSDGILVTGSGSGGVVMAADFTYTGGTVLTAGTINLGGGGTKGSIVGDLVLNNPDSQLYLSRLDDYTLTANIYGTGKVVKYRENTVTLTGAHNYRGVTDIRQGALNFKSDATQFLWGAIIGSGDLIKSGTGQLYVPDLSGFTGTITIAEGTLAMNKPGQAQTFSGGIIGSGNLLQQYAPLILTGKLTYTGTTTIASNASLTFGYAEDQKLTGAVTGDGTLIKTGSGTLTLAGTNSFLGPTIIQEGTLAFTSQADQTLVQGVVGSGNLVKNGAGTLTLKGDNSYSGQTSILQGTLAFDIAGTSSLSGRMTGNGNLTKAGTGTLALSGASEAFHGSTIVHGGTLQFGATKALYGGSPSLWTANRITVQAGATLALNLGSQVQDFKAAHIDAIKLLGSATGGFQSGSFLGLDTTHATAGFEYAGAIADPNHGANALGLKKLGANTLILSGNNSYTGMTQVLDGTLQVGNGGSTGSLAGNVLVNGAIVFNRADDSSLAGSISGTGSLTKQGNGVLTLNGAASYSGITHIAAGTLAFAANADQTLAGSVKGNGSLTKAGTGTLTLAGDNSYSGETRVLAGTLQLGGRLDGTTQVSVAAGARLATAGSDAVQITLRTVNGQPPGSISLDGTLAINDGSAGKLVLDMAPGTTLSWGPGAHLEFDLGSAPDLITFSRNGHWFSGSGGAFLDLDVGNTGFDYTRTYTLFHNVQADGFSFAGITGYDSAHYRAVLRQEGRDLNISFSAVAVPEPQSWVLTLAGLMVVGGWSRRRAGSGSAPACRY